MKDYVDSGQPPGPTSSKAFLYVPVGSAVVIVVALVLGFTDVIPLGFALGVVGIAATAMVVVMWSYAERSPYSWTRTGVADDEDDDAPRR
ncbi:hypothetical protein [Georgenia wangjunii]|uniref:hypothetical protein n=1 Tax=Georgenia wangjunii TaxID=3117730 RepID=UPI002F26AF75